MATAECAPTRYLHPGQIFADGGEHWVSTILGSCISVCLWDPQARAGGINHFMLPLWNGEGLPTPKYGNIAIHKLLETLMGLGCTKRLLVAKVFGGARVVPEAGARFCVGDRNALLALEALSRNGIAIAATRLGGSEGLRVLFNTHTGAALVNRISPGDPLLSGLPEARIRPFPSTLRGEP